MNRAEECDFAWALVDAAGGFLSGSSRSWVCSKIGAGDQNGAIRDLLTGFVHSGTGLPSGLLSSLWAWVGGFAGTAGESGLRELAFRLRIAGSNYRPELPDRRPVRLVAQRSAVASMKTASAPR